jgi:hypothetical protein
MTADNEDHMKEPRIDDHFRRPVRLSYTKRNNVGPKCSHFLAQFFWHFLRSAAETCSSILSDIRQARKPDLRVLMLSPELRRRDSYSAPENTRK